MFINLNRKIASFLNFITSPSLFSKKAWNFIVIFARLIKVEQVSYTFRTLW